MFFTSFPILTTERLTLQQLHSNNQEDIYSLRSNPTINQYLNRQPCQTIEDAIHFINMVNGNIEKGISLYWAITLTASNKFVGTICLFNFSTENTSCEIGYELLPSFQGKGIMREAAQQVIDYAFKIMKLKKVIALVHFKNQPSIQLLTKLQFAKSLENDKEDRNLNIFTLTQDY